jgi:hypothetical protein
VGTTTAVISSGAKDNTVDHETVHILLKSDAHSPNPNKLMYFETSNGSNKYILPSDVEKMRNYDYPNPYTGQGQAALQTGGQATSMKVH